MRPLPIATASPLRTIEFDAGLFDEAQADTQRLPVKALQAPSTSAHWLQRRRPPVPTDVVLSSATWEWLMQLPMPVRPHATSVRFARVMNQLCQVWDEPAACKAAFDNLLYERRGGRKGFPPEVLRELKILRFHRLTCAVQ